MTRALLFLALACGLSAQVRRTGPEGGTGAERPGWWKRHLGDSAIHLGATSLDAASSWGRPELHPLLRSADGRFGARGLGGKLAVYGAVEVTKWLLLRRGERGRWVRSLSLGPAAAFGGVAARNWRAR